MLAHGQLLCLVPPLHGHGSLFVSMHLVDFDSRVRSSYFLKEFDADVFAVPSYSPARIVTQKHFLSSFPWDCEDIFTDLVMAGVAYLSGHSLRAVIHIGMTF